MFDHRLPELIGTGDVGGQLGSSIDFGNEAICFRFELSELREGLKLVPRSILVLKSGFDFALSTERQEVTVVNIEVFAGSADFQLGEKGVQLEELLLSRRDGSFAKRVVALLALALLTEEGPRDVSRRQLGSAQSFS